MKLNLLFLIQPRKISITGVFFRQVTGVNGGDNELVRCVSVCVCSVCAADREATYFKFDMHVLRDSPDVTP